MKQTTPASTHPRPLRVLRIDSSARGGGSTTHALADALIDRLRLAEGRILLQERDLALSPPRFIDPDWVEANFTPPEERDETRRAILAESDGLVSELQATDVLVIGVPIYNFGIPATLKAWIDQVARARLTFRYTENGPVGLLSGKRAYLLVASGGTEVGSEIDFATGYLRHMLGFIGIDDVEIVAADRSNARGRETALAEARGHIRELLPTHPPLAATA